MINQRICAIEEMNPTKKACSMTAEEDFTTDPIHSGAARRGKDLQEGIPGI